MTDKAYTQVFYDILEKVLQYSENPSQFAEFLSQQIRELIGTRTVAVVIKTETGDAQIFSVYPLRKSGWAHQPDFLKFAQDSFDFGKVVYLDKNDTDQKLSVHYTTLGIDKTIVIPLVAADRIVGSLLLLDIMDDQGTDAIIDLFNRLAGVFALVIRNSVLYHNLEETVMQRTSELQKRNAELEEREKELKMANQGYEVLNEILKQTNENLMQAKEKAEESDRLKTAFLQNMSHEIRTPMNAIMGFSSLLVTNYNNKPKIEKYSTIINQRCNDLLEIINDILDIAKIESDQLTVSFEQCDLGLLFDELTAFFVEYRNRLEKQHIRFHLTVDCGPSNRIILTDKVKLKQIFINLLSNAFKFTETGSIEGGCMLTDNNEIRFFVTDTGIGIPADKQNLVFERFAQLNQGVKKNLGGTGLGLSIVKGLVTLLGGEITLQSEPNRGSTFTFTIPYQNVPDTSDPIVIAEETKHTTHQGKTVLVVEDDVYNADYIRELLTDSGLTILQAGNGKEALEITNSQPVDLILMDIRLPDISGYEATRLIHQQRSTIKIIAQTAYASHDERQKAINAGCSDYISKPIKRDLLLSMVDKLLD